MYQTNNLICATGETRKDLRLWEVMTVGEHNNMTVTGQLDYLEAEWKGAANFVMSGKRLAVHTSPEDRYGAKQLRAYTDTPAWR